MSGWSMLARLCTILNRLPTQLMWQVVNIRAWSRTPLIRATASDWRRCFKDQSSNLTNRVAVYHLCWKTRVRMVVSMPLSWVDPFKGSRRRWRASTQRSLIRLPIVRRMPLHSSRDSHSTNKDPQLRLTSISTTCRTTMFVVYSFPSKTMFRREIIRVSLKPAVFCRTKHRLTHSKYIINDPPT